MATAMPPRAPQSRVVARCAAPAGSVFVGVTLKLTLVRGVPHLAVGSVQLHPRRVTSTEVR